MPEEVKSDRVPGGAVRRWEFAPPNAQEKAIAEAKALAEEQ